MAFRKIVDFIQADVITGFIKDKLEATMVARNVVDVRTQAQLGYGSSYKVPGVGALTVNSYAGNAITPENATSTNEIIAMDQYPYVSYYLEDSDVNEASALSVAGAWANEAGVRIAQVVDKYIFTKITADAETATGLGVTTVPIALTDDTKVLDYIELFATTLKEANIDTDAVMVIPAFLETSLTRSMGTLSSNQAVSGTIEAGKIGRLFGIDIYSSTNLPTGVAGGLVAGEYRLLGGKRSCFHLVEGTMVVKSGDSETRPASWNQLGMVYGADFSNATSWYTGVVTK
jgi:hypothetical protein